MMVRIQRPDLEEILGQHERYVEEHDFFSLEEWQYVGSGSTVPDFQNGWTNAGAGRVPLRFRWLPDSGLEIQGSVGGGSPGTVVFTLPDHTTPPYSDIYRPDYIMHFIVADDVMSFQIVTLFPNGDVQIG
jgi:hypothetical protein